MSVMSSSKGHVALRKMIKQLAAMNILRPGGSSSKNVAPPTPPPVDALYVDEDGNYIIDNNGKYCI